MDEINYCKDIINIKVVKIVWCIILCFKVNDIIINRNK